MKHLMKIGVLLLFMIGLFTVQLDFKPILVDDDVGMEYTDNLNSLDDAVLTVILENPGQVAAPLKYPLLSSVIYTTKMEKEICSNQFVLYNSFAAIPDDTMSGQIKEQTTKVKLTDKTDITEGLFRLDIGESFNQNYIS